MRNTSWVLVAGVAALIVVFRLLLGGGVFDQVWAEDGAVFLADARTHGVASFIYQYSGYGHGVPRLLALIGSWLPLASFGAYVVVAAAVVTGLLAGYVFAVAREVTGTPVWAAVAALALVLVPAQRDESLGNLANLQWVLLPAAAWGVLDRRPYWLATGLVTFAAAVTTPLALLLVPALLIAQGKAAWRHPALPGLALGLASQALIIRRGPSSMANPSDRVPGVQFGMVRDVLSQLGEVEVINASIAVGAVLLLATVGAWVFGGRSDRCATALASSALLLMVVPTVVNGSVQPRYVAAAFVVLVGAACVSAQGLGRVTGSAVAGVLAAAAVLGFAVSPYRVSGPAWSTAAHRIEASCPASPPKVEFAPAGWGAIRFPC